MSLTQVTGPYPIFTDLDGSPLDDGYLYIGDQNDDPETNPIQVYWDSALTIPATQPIRTNSGYAWRNGSPGLLYTAGAFSITIRNKKNEFVLYSPVGYGFDPAAVSASVVKNDFVGDGVEVDFTLSAAPSTILATNVFINGVYQEKDSYSLLGNVITFTIAPPLNSSIEIMTNETGVINSGNATAISYTLTAPGAVAQTVQTKLEQYVSVKDFGAVGDGVTDDTATIADALATGASVYFPEGTYKTDLQTITTAGQTLFGAGEKSIILAKTAGANLFVVEADYVSFRNLRMNGAETGPTNNDFAIFTATATPAQFLAVENVLFSGASAASGFNNAVKFDSGCNYGSVIGCVIERLWGNLSGNGYGILNGANNATFRDNTMLASSGRGRHGIYISSGASDNEISGNFLSAFDLEGITQYSTGVQPACARNKYIGNSLIACAASNNPTSGSIGIYGHSSGAVISANTITSSGQIGIAVDGTGVTDCANTIVSDNFVAFSAKTGINLISPIACSVTGNIVYESSTASVGTSANIQIKSDATTAPSDILIEGNHAWGPVYSRSAVRIDPTTPTPVKTKLQFNAFSAGASGTIETNSVSGIQIDGRLQFTFLGTSYGPIANGAAFAGGLSLPGAEQGDICTVSHTSNTDGCLFTVQATSTDNGTLNIGNLSGGSKTIASGTLRVDVWKRYS
jgi:hypothetical protein